jgi:putative heme-binding domain-containing protein
MTLAIRQGDQKAAEDALKLIESAVTPKQKRSELIQVFGEVKYPPIVAALLKVVHDSKNPSLQKDAISALALYENPEIAPEIISLLPTLSPEIQLVAFNVLTSRSPSSKALVKAVDQGALKRKQIPPEILDKLRSDETLAASVEQTFGPKPTLDKAALDAKLQTLASTIQSGTGDPFEGQKNFQLACATCHRLFGEGGQIGPDLTTYKRDDLNTMLMNIVNPSGEIREGYENILIETKDGRSLSGFIVEKYDDAVVLRDLAGETTLIPKKEMVSFKSAGRSIMPEGLLDAFNDHQLRDLFAYLRSTQPLVKQR